jgi:polar amino acid transport system substrate-binding protein
MRPLHRRHFAMVPPRWVLGAFSAVIAISALAACGSSAPAPRASGTSPALSKADIEARALLPDGIKTAGTILVGASFTSAPQIQAEANDPSMVTGIVPDLAAALEPILGVKFKFINTAFPGQLPGLAAGRFNILWGNISDNADREQSIADMVPYWHFTEGLLVDKGNPRHLEGFDSSCGATIGIPTGAVQTTIITGINQTYCALHGLPPIKSATYQTDADIITALLSGQINAGSTSYLSCLEYAQANPDAFSAVEVPQSEVAPYVSGIEAIAVSKSDPGISQALALALKDLIQNGTYEKIVTKWGAESGAYAASGIKVNPITGTKPGTTS